MHYKIILKTFHFMWHSFQEINHQQNYDTSVSWKMPH